MTTQSFFQNADFWKRKLAAFLHDPPHKPLDFSKTHEEDARSILKAAMPGFDDDSFRELVHAVRDSDWTASAADRFCFPKGAVPSTFTGKSGGTFRHPLGRKEHEAAAVEYLIDGGLPTPGAALDLLQNAFGGIRVDEDADEASQWRQRFFLYWRRFMEQTVTQDSPHALNMAYYPADTRIPDHTVWNHMSMASALEGCRVDGNIRPAFLIFQVGPVQDFIAAARSTRDLWSGSYLLAWLVASAIKAVADTVGPDSIIFPALRGQGVFDILNREDNYSSVEYRAGDSDRMDSLWQRMYPEGDKAGIRRLLSPTLPNRFVALVPEDRAGELGRAAESALRQALSEMSEKCLKAFENAVDAAGGAWDTDYETRWRAQVAAFPQVAWVAVPWQRDIGKALAESANLPVNRQDGWTPQRILQDNKAFADSVNLPPDNAGFLWMLNYHRAEFALAARRNTREFDQFATDDNQVGAVKDALTGREEVVGSEDLWNALKGKGPFKKNEGPYGAVTLLKRLWWRAETEALPVFLDMSEKNLRGIMRLDSVADIAANNFPGGVDGSGWSREKDEDGEAKPRNPYVAILAMDGDEMGKWVSGEKMPKLLDQVAEIAKDYLLKQGINTELPRALTPSYHMQFSEALANVATYLVGPIVEHYGGQLIYAGGDDVLAMLPAVHALNCARALRAAFKGMASELPEEQRNYKLASTQDGFVIAEGKYPLIVPGPAAEVSCGIAIAHYQHPLQAIVREARNAERRAKQSAAKGGHGRAAFAVSLMKRGGETIHWGAKWNSGALALYDLYCGLRNGDAPVLSARFPYALAGLLAPYDLAKRKRFEAIPAAELRPVVRAELEHVLCQQGNWSGRQAGRGTFLDACQAYLDNLPESRLADFANLFLTAAFIFRDRTGNDKEGTDHADV